MIFKYLGRYQTIGNTSETPDTSQDAQGRRAPGPGLDSRPRGGRPRGQLSYLHCPRSPLGGLHFRQRLDTVRKPSPARPPAHPGPSSLLCSEADATLQPTSSSLSADHHHHGPQGLRCGWTTTHRKRRRPHCGRAPAPSPAHLASRICCLLPWAAPLLQGRPPNLRRWPTDHSHCWSWAGAGQPLRCAPARLPELLRAPCSLQ